MVILQPLPMIRASQCRHAVWELADPRARAMALAAVWVRHSNSQIPVAHCIERAGRLMAPKRIKPKQTRDRMAM